MTDCSFTYPSPLPPSPKFFLKPLIKTLGIKTDWLAHTYIRGLNLLEDVLRECGYDPANLTQYGDPDYGWRLSGGPDTHMSFARRIWYAFRLGHRTGDSQRMEPLTEKGPQNGLWGLTDAGLRLALTMRPPAPVICQIPVVEKPAPMPNATSAFLNKRLEETGGLGGSFWQFLRGTVSRRFPISYKVGLIDDHIQTCMVRLIHRDALRERIEQGRTISDSHIALYVTRSAYNDCRDAATEPVLRELCRARTKKERDEHHITNRPAEGANVIWDNEAEFSDVWDDIEDPASLASEYEDMDFFNVIWDQVEQIILAKKPEHHAKYMQLLRLRYEGLSFDDVSTVMDIPAPQARVLFSKIREMLVSAAMEGNIDIALPSSIQTKVREKKIRLRKAAVSQPTPLDK